RATLPATRGMVEVDHRCGQARFLPGATEARVWQIRAGHLRADRVRPKSPAGSVHHSSGVKPAAESSASTRSHRNLAEISVRISSAAAKHTVRSSSAAVTTWAWVDRSLISIHSFSGSHNATWLNPSRYKSAFN